MSAELPTHLSAIDFTLDLKKLTRDFTGRQWVFDDIDRWLRESDERFFILTGEPGVGKSAIAARLALIPAPAIKNYSWYKQLLD
ncbi:hypothetical protein H6F90_10570 [Trichocoleus sp. FACHB-591]|uniref:hypothetical protein n=1 Tax=Trichocoleus sp. FACHB-591 TaxID=2692872 RepID=UPI001684AE9D|nr:hypothetical protein [Trichocoleus sp. FACHB-591]MBD2095600.1 hypothetical protein [Trichocoleus sp. FACHB-591]